MEVQIFGVRKSADTRAAIRFFAERRIKMHFVDLNERAASLGELRRFAQKFGVQALIDRDGRRFAELGLKSALLSEERWLEKLSLEPLLLRMPLVRSQQHLTVGAADDAWRAWVAATRAPA
jgi:arsenate reductase